MEQSYDDIERAMVHGDPNCEIITEDFKAKIETKTKEEECKIMAAPGTKERNERGDRLIEFA